jgi:hypothetical protein
MVRDFVTWRPRAAIADRRDGRGALARNFISAAWPGEDGAPRARPSEVRAGSSRDLVEALVLTERAERELREQLRTIPEIQELQLRRLQLGGGDAGAGEGAPTLLLPREATVERLAGAAPGLADRDAPK